MKMSREKEIAEKIIKYFHERPDAGDTLEGISKFWLGKTDHTVRELKNALDILVKNHVVIIIKRKGNEPIYKLFFH